MERVLNTNKRKNKLLIILISLLFISCPRAPYLDEKNEVLDLDKITMDLLKDKKVSVNDDVVFCISGEIDKSLFYTAELFCVVEKKESEFEVFHNVIIDNENVHKGNQDDNYLFSMEIENKKFENIEEKIFLAFPYEGEYRVTISINAYTEDVNILYGTIEKSFCLEVQGK